MCIRDSTKRTNAAKRVGNCDGDTDTVWTDSDIQLALPVFEGESAIIVPIDGNCSDLIKFHCY